MSTRENLALIVSTRPLPREERPSIYFKTQGTPRRERLSTQRPARSGGCTRLFRKSWSWLPSPPKGIQAHRPKTTRTNLHQPHPTTSTRARPTSTPTNEIHLRIIPCLPKNNPHPLEPDCNHKRPPARTRLPTPTQSRIHAFPPALRLRMDGRAFVRACA